MILISHRGNLDGPIIELENQPNYIDLALDSGFDCEIDLWSVDSKIYLGHDLPQYEISYDWILMRKNYLWLHCKNVEIFRYFRQLSDDLNYFWHQEDTLTFTSKGFVWVFPGKQPIPDSIAVMPELFNDDVIGCLGVCSDFINSYKFRSSE